MASQVSPGIILKERDLSNVVVVGAQQITAAFAATFVKGPINEIVNVNSQKELVNIFGKPTDANAEDWYVASEFLSYGGRLAVVRASTSVLNASSGATGVLVENRGSWEAGAGSAETFVARTAGTSGNSVKVVVIDRGADQILTLGTGLDNIPVVGTAVAFNVGGSTKTASVYSYNPSSKQLAVVLDDPSTLISTSNTFEDGNEIATFTHDATTEAGRTPGTYTPAAHAGGASFQVVVADAGAGVGGAVTVTLLTAGDGYEIGDTITLTGAATGGGSDITVTVATLDADVAITAVSDWYSNTDISGTGIKLGAIGPRPGTSEYASDKGLLYDELHIAIIDSTGVLTGSAGTIVEKFTYLSKLSDGKNTEGGNVYYKNVINEVSNYLYIGTSPSAIVNPSSIGAGVTWDQVSSELNLGDLFALSGLVEETLSGGTDDYAYTNAEIGDALDLFLDTENTEVDFILMGGSMATENDTKAKANKIVSIASSRKDCIAFVSPHKGNQVGNSGALTVSQQKVNTINFFNGLTSTSYAIFDSGYKYFYDRFNDKYRYLPCNGDVAGLCVATSATLDDWYSPAGVNKGSLRNAIKLAYNPNKADRDELYQARINPIVSFPGSGVTLFGDKTALASPSAFDRINVRRLFLNVEKRVGNLAKQVLFEQNDEGTRSSFSSAVNSYLNEVQSRRGVTDYLVVCDDSNNTPDVIDRNEFVAEIYIKPTRSINYITITFTATKTGVSFNEVVGR